jgi:hypothetical protein
MENRTLNQTTLMILAPLLIVTGIAGFVLPDGYSLIWSAIQDKGRWKRLLLRTTTAQTGHCTC